MRLPNRTTRSLAFKGALGTLALTFAVSAWAGGLGQSLFESRLGKVDRSMAQPSGLGGPKPFVGKVAFAPGVVLVSYRKGAKETDRKNLEARFGLRVDRLRSGKFFTRYFTDGFGETATRVDLQTLAETLDDHPNVAYAELDYAIKPDQALPNDADFNQLWGLHNTGQTGGTFDADVNAPEAWAVAGNHAPTVVAVADDGVNWAHPDLLANIWANPGEILDGIDNDGNGRIDDIRGWDFVDNDNNPTPASGSEHGTHCAGTVGAVHNNGIGVAGIARNVRIMPLRMYNGQASWLSDLANAIDYAWQNGAKVISVSYNLDGWNNTVLQAIQRAGQNDVIYVNSAGNNGENIDTRRGVIRTQTTNTIFVAATDHNDTLASFSNFGNTVEVGAPGVNIRSTIPGGYANWDGTSMATPHVAGALGVIRALYPNLNARQALDRLIASATPRPALQGRFTGGRRLNLEAALENDSIPPSNPTAYRFLARNTQTAIIEFKGSGDDGTVGQAAYYDIRIAEREINASNFDSARQIASATPRVNAGTRVEIPITGLKPGTTYMVGIRAMDNVGNASPAMLRGKLVTQPATIITGFEGTTSGFTPTSGTWSLTNVHRNSGQQSYSDAPGTGQYGNNLNIATIQDATFPVNGVNFLRMALKYDLESNYDFLYVDASTDNGANWSQLGRFTGNSDWANVSFMVLGNAGQNAKIRFRMTTDGSVTRDGVYIDDISLVTTTELMNDNMENPATFSSPNGWLRDSVRFSSPSTSWTDPSGSAQYANNVNNWLDQVSPFSGSGDKVLVFRGWLNTESGYDFLRVQNSANGAAFSELARFSGNTNGWQTFAVPLGAALQNRLRFNFTSDGSVQGDGVWVDDVMVVSEPMIPWRNFDGLFGR